LNTTSSPLPAEEVLCADEALVAPAAMARARLIFGVVEATATLCEEFQLTLVSRPALSGWVTRSPPMTRRPLKVRS